MKIKEVLESTKKSITPSSTEKKKVTNLVNNILKKVNYQLKKDKVKAKLIIGGSVAKGTWLPGISDADFFMLFNYGSYKDQSAQLDDLAQRVLRKCFRKVERLHGSRDYFAIQKDSFYLEIVPVLGIKKISQAKNITDASPLHVTWIKNKILKKPSLVDEIRLAKQFLKAQGIYGAESYIRGLSGHVIEILTIKYGSFLKLLAAASRWKIKDVIDIEGHYRSAAEVFRKLNPSKLQSPIIVVDPVESDRNAAAALDKEKFKLLKKVCKEFLKKPDVDFFKAKKVNVNDLYAKKGNRKLIALRVQPERRKIDIAGAKLLKRFEQLNYRLRAEDFTILESGWQWLDRGPALFWFYFPKAELPKTRIHLGPPISAPKKFIKEFKSKWKKHKVKITKKRYCVELPRKFRLPEKLLQSIIRSEKLKIKILKVC